MQNTPSTPILLSQARKQQRGILVTVPDDPQLASLGFRGGKRIQVHSAGVWNGPLICSIDQRMVAIGRDLAAQVTLEVLD